MGIRSLAVKLSDKETQATIINNLNSVKNGLPIISEDMKAVAKAMEGDAGAKSELENRKTTDPELYEIYSTVTDGAAKEKEAAAQWEQLCTYPNVQYTPSSTCINLLYAAEDSTRSDQFRLAEAKYLKKTIGVIDLKTDNPIYAARRLVEKELNETSNKE